MAQITSLFVETVTFSDPVCLARTGTAVVELANGSIR